MRKLISENNVRNQERDKKDYLNAVQNFQEPASDEKRIGQDIDGINEYDLAEKFDHYNNKEISGRLEKRFIRLKSEMLPELFQAIKSGKSSYVTYLNHEDIKKGFVKPENISVLLKKENIYDLFGGGEQLFKITNEVITSRILNFFEVDTVFNESVVAGQNFYILSVDFLKPNTKFYPTNGIDGAVKFKNYHHISDMVDVVKYNLNELAQQIKQEYQREDVSYNEKQILENFVYMYLAKVWGVGDFDFSSNNFGYVFNEKTGEITAGPAHDFEFICLNVNLPTTNLDWVRENYAHLYKKFFDKFIKFNKFNLLMGTLPYKKIIAQTVKDEELKKEYDAWFDKNNDRLMEYYEKHKPKSFGE